MLCEASGRLGGQAVLAALPPYRQEMGDIVTQLSRQVHKLGVEVRLNTEVTLDLVRRSSPDAVIVATGATPLRPDRVMGGMPAATANQVLAGEAPVGPRVVVWGGDETGAQTAEYLAARGHQVTIVHEQPRLAKDMTSFDRVGLKRRLAQLGVRVLVKASVEETDTGRLTVLSPEGREVLAADSLVFSLGLAPVQDLYQELKAHFPQVYAAGDCVTPRKALQAIHEGFRAGMQV